jgi:spectrin beta
MNTEMQGDQRVRDLQTAEWFFQDHQRLCAEIAAREPKYEELYATGSQLLAAKHFASKDIEQRIGQIKEAYEAVKVECNLRNQWINQVGEELATYRLWTVFLSYFCLLYS